MHPTEMLARIEAVDKHAVTISSLFVLATRTTITPTIPTNSSSSSSSSPPPPSLSQVINVANRYLYDTDHALAAIGPIYELPGRTGVGG